jgi:hypothetical protein
LVFRSVANPARFSSSESMFRRCRARRELHLPENRSLAGDSLREEDSDAGPPPKPQPPDDDDSC